MTKCTNLEPKDPSHNIDLTNANNLIKEKDRLDEYYQKKQFDKVEEVSEKILKDSPEFTTIKIYYITALLANCKLEKAEQFLKGKVLQDEKQKYEDLEFLEARLNYYQGK